MTSQNLSSYKFRLLVLALLFGGTKDKSDSVLGESFLLVKVIDFF